MDDDDAHAWNYMPSDGGRPADDQCIDPMVYHVAVRDHSYYVLVGIYDEFISTYNDFYDNYFLKAHEYCAYDDFSGKFNDFFAQAMAAAYPENLLAPWYRMVTTYVYYQDIISGAYGGNTSYMLESAMSLLATIRPETGNLEALDALEQSCRAIKEAYENIRSFATEMYIEDSGLTHSEINVNLDLLDSSVTIEIPSLNEACDLTRTWVTTVYDHIGDYSSMTLDGEWGDILYADSDGDST
jgi:hypothetical protein